MFVLGWTRNEFWTGTAVPDVDVDIVAASWLPNKDVAGKVADVMGGAETLKAGREGQDEDDGTVVGMQLVMKLTMDELTFWTAVVTLVDELSLAPGNEKDKTAVDAGTTVWVAAVPKSTVETAAVPGTSLKPAADGKNNAPLDEVVCVAKLLVADFDGLNTNPPCIDGNPPTLVDIAARVDGGNIGLNSLLVEDVTDDMETDEDNVVVWAVMATVEDVITSVAGLLKAGV